MKIKVEEIQNITEEEIIIRCRSRDERVESIISTLTLFDNKIAAKKDGRNYLLKLQDIYYFESVDNKVFCYTEKDVFEISMKLYEIENTYFDTNFIRISKNMIVDAGRIVSFKAQLNGRMEAILSNGEKVEVSRNYVSALKVKLRGKKK